MTKLLLVFLCFSYVIFSHAKSPHDESYIGTRIEYQAHQLTVTDSTIAKKIFLKLPGHFYHAGLAPELLIKNHRYFYCTREPDGKFSCNIYLNFKYNGELSSFEKDLDYGLGSMTEYLSEDKIAGVGEVKLAGNYIDIYYEGELAKKVFSKMDLAKTDYKRKSGTDYEIRSGRHTRCVSLYADKEVFSCRMRLPIDPNKKKEEIPLNPNA
ncbi:hypothetical protein [Bacteriovorax sp. Seq25_V]|uniref:hypothetical protein n=1 Tax=Bacteriovorax sp. Seq25_V TaxID=1201288 RepID=UPI00038A0E97|nr:hypothetical protein [Bacteriovorax sp. Seq25_V]EQC45457.1 hypothetical protein M900_1974 [Bacteriovorax sp. Seq25_V]